MDVFLADGDAADVEWTFEKPGETFKCKPPDRITDLAAQDYLGIVIKIDGDRIDMSMAKYIDNAVRVLAIEGKS